METVRRYALASLSALLLAVPASAVPIAFLGTFDDPSATESDGDVFVLTNPTPSSQSSITQIVIDLQTANQLPITFDPSVGTGSPFTATSGAAQTGFLAAVFSAGNTVLTLTFSDFDPGESFSFTVDLDDNNTRIDQNRIRNTLVTATFAAGNTPLAAAMVDPGGSGRNTTWSVVGVAIPEPSALPLLCSGLIVLALRHRAARRRARAYPCSYA